MNRPVESLAARLDRALASTLRPALYLSHEVIGDAGFFDVMEWAINQPRGSIGIDDDTWNGPNGPHRTIRIRDHQGRITIAITGMPIAPPTHEELHVN